MNELAVDLSSYIVEIIKSPSSHAMTSEQYLTWKLEIESIIDKAYQNDNAPMIKFTDNFNLILPFHEMGNINTKHLFGLDELIILSFYISNCHKYSSVLDLGANIGLHTIALGKLGLLVESYEPDPSTFSVLRNNIKLNNLQTVKAINSAVASYSGTAEFTRVCGNLTGSHLSGSKLNPYGALELFDVDVVNICEIVHNFTLIKMDIEGQEADVFINIPETAWDLVDVMMEVNGIENAKVIFERAELFGLNLFLQKDGWNKAISLDDLPLSYRDGSVFVSKKDQMNW